VAHLVDQIIGAIKTRLTGLTTTGANVFDGNPRSLLAADLPALVIEEGEDKSEPITKLYPRTVAHTVQMSVRCFVKATSPASTLRQIRLEVEKAMSAAAPSLGGLTRDIRCTGAYARQQDFESDTQVSSTVVTFEIDYTHLETAPDVAS
jgi:hypothetical protein